MNTPPLPDKKYDIIYADPPWQYRHCASDSRKIENKYDTLQLKDIKNLDIPAKDNSILYLWATAPKLREAVEVIDAWNFDYRTCAVWDKCKLGMGYWFRGQHELLLIGIKGEMSPPRQNQRVSSVIRTPRSKHSAKPTIVRNWINKWYPNKSKIELFARKPKNVLFEDPSFEGWDVWGNEC